MSHLDVGARGPDGRGQVLARENAPRHLHRTHSRQAVSGVRHSLAVRDRLCSSQPGSGSVAGHPVRELWAASTDGWEQKRAHRAKHAHMALPSKALGLGR